MAITKNDIKALKAVRMTDTPDGGGRMSSEVLISGEDNNLFDDVSALARVYGEVSLRKLFPAVLTDTRDKYLGARVIIDQPPADPNVHGLLFGASSLFDVRAEAQSRLESYLTEGPNASLILYGPHIAGTANVAFIKQVANLPPTEGDVLVLRRESTGVFQYIRITGVEVVTTTFTDGSGDFVRDVVTISISDPLRFDFPGFQATRYDTDLDFTLRTRVMTTVIADAAQYYGIRPLALPAATGSYTVRADSSFSNLLPSAQIESPIALALPYAAARLPVSGAETITYEDDSTWNETTALHLAGGVRPGTLVIQSSSTTITDEGGKLVVGVTEVGAIDYPSGILTLFEDNFSGYKTVRFQPAAYVMRAPQSSEVPVTEFGRRLNYTGVIDPIPAPGTLTLSYLSQGRWYVLTDSGTGVLRGLDSGYGAGTINGDTGAFLVTLGALPDVGSSLIFTWNAPTQETRHLAKDIKAQQIIELELPGDGSIQPGSLTVKWTDGTLQTATANTDGTLSGPATGFVSVSQGGLLFQPNVMPPFGTLLQVEYVEGPRQEDSFAHPSRNGGGQVPVTATLGSIAPGSLEVEWNTFTSEAVLGTYTLQQLREMGIVDITNTARPVFPGLDPTQYARDDGAGSILLNGVSIGTVNYATGAVVFNPDVTIRIPSPRYSAVELGMSWTYRLNYGGLDYVSAPSLYPNDESGYVKLRYNSAGATNNRLETYPFQPSFDLVPGTNAPLVPGSVIVRPHAAAGSGLWSDSSTGTLRERTDAGWLTRGTINYLTGQVSIAGWRPGQINNFQRLNAVTTLGENISSEFVFRTASAPLRPGSVSLQFARSTGGVQNLSVPTDGVISAPGISGKVDHEAGIVRVRFGTYVLAAGNEDEPWFIASAVNEDGEIFKPAPVATSTIRYSATAYSYLPLDADILGLDPVRLPTDGRVPVFKSGRVVVVHHTSRMAPQAVTNGLTVATGSERLARLRVFGADGLEITNGFTTSLDAGTVTFENVSGYSQPVEVELRIEDEALCAEAQITGELRLTRPLTHDFPLGSYVSSAYVRGTLQAGAQEAFSQETWTNAWSDQRIGVPILAQYNDTIAPIAVTNAGAITERWVCIFQNDTTFQLVGENTGQIMLGTTGADLAPVNPATGVPYFTLPAMGWGTGWVAGNILRFNTTGANFPLWVSRTVMQSPAAPPGTDQLIISIRGDIDQ